MLGHMRRHDFVRPCVHIMPFPRFCRGSCCAFPRFVTFPDPRAREPGGVMAFAPNDFANLLMAWLPIEIVACHMKSATIELGNRFTIELVRGKPPPPSVANPSFNTPRLIDFAISYATKYERWGVQRTLQTILTSCKSYFSTVLDSSTTKGHIDGFLRCFHFWIRWIEQGPNFAEPVGWDFRGGGYFGFRF